MRIRVCTGMSCSMNGGGHRLEHAFEEALQKAGVTDQVELLTAHCLGSCESGPCVRIDGEKFHHVHEEDVLQLLQEEILPRLEKEG